MEIRIKKISTNAFIPEYKTPGAAGFDLHSVESVTIKPGQTVAVGTGLAFEIPHNFELRIQARSGLSYKTKLRVSNSVGCVDSDFRGEVKVLLDNTGNEYIKINYGDRIAQGIISPVIKGSFNVVDELSETSRGVRGFGSTGV